MTRDNQFAHVRKLLEKQFVDGEDKITVEITEFRGEEKIDLNIYNRYGDGAGVELDPNSPMFIEFAIAIYEIAKQHMIEL